MSKQKKSRRHRSVNRTPRPVGRQSESLHDSRHACLPHQSQGPGVTVYRDQAELIDGRAYPATARMNVDAEPVKFDLIANMYAVAHGEVTGPCAGVLTALALTYTENHQGLLKSISPDEEPPLTIAALTDSFRRFFEEGLLGRDGNGGYSSFERLHAAHA
ncbi:hypothetical protein ACFWEH_35935 [Streptomyces anulatus]|uniref:hypothetical protein n=1 Tax=Streptomyces TaxID=1883 RepID=UPI00093AFA0A|nr:hypothetical protein [Streptomyces sp. TSRI0395]OKI74054.1 hypothetical protein AMK12_37440 [Streptomyces sp. TSRI0395]